jgi:hypothetical protein
MNTKSKTVAAFEEQATLLRDYTRPVEGAMFTAQRCAKIAARLELEREADDVLAQKIRSQTARMRRAIGSNVGWREFAEAALQVERELNLLREQHGHRKKD